MVACFLNGHRMGANATVSVFEGTYASVCILRAAQVIHFPHLLMYTFQSLLCVPIVWHPPTHSLHKSFQHNTEPCLKDPAR